MSLLSISVTRTDVQEQLVTKGIADNVLTERTQMSQDSSKEIFCVTSYKNFYRAVLLNQGCASPVHCLAQQVPSGVCTMHASLSYVCPLFYLQV